ncbi:MAG: hypothetical protein ACTSO7_16655 [Candidatus Heimdallarchaeota archaeon]
MKIKIPTILIVIAQFLAGASLFLGVIFNVAKATIFNITEYVRIWGTSFIIDPSNPEANLQFDYEFGPGNFGAIKPLFIIGLVLTMLFTMTLSNPSKEITFFTKFNFLFFRISRLLYLIGAICGFSAFMLFAKFINQMNQLFSIYQFNFIFYICSITYGLGIVLGFLGVISKIELELEPEDISTKYKKAKKELSQRHLERKSGVIEKFVVPDTHQEIYAKPIVEELELPLVNSIEMTKKEKLEQIRTMIQGKDEISLTWLETITLIPYDEISEIVTSKLGFVVVNGFILTPEEAKKRINRK